MRHEYETKLDGQQLAAFAAVIQLGSFEPLLSDECHPVGDQSAHQGARAASGAGIVVRGKPCVATVAGVPLLQPAAQTTLLESEALAELGEGDNPTQPTRISIAVNADSMATWSPRSSPN